MIDESYSFSLRQFEKQASKRDNFENSRMSNMSAYAPGQDPSISAPGSVQRGSTNKLNVMGSSEFGPFSKRRGGGAESRTSQGQFKTPVEPVVNTDM